MTEPKDKDTIFGMPVGSFGRREDNTLEDDEPLPLPQRIRRWLATPPSLGWPLMGLLWLILAFNLYDIVSTYVTGHFGIHILNTEIPPVWAFAMQKLSAILRTLAVFGILRTKHWGFTFYLVATFSFLVFCAVPEFKPVIFLLQMACFIALLLLLRGKWELFD